MAKHTHKLKRHSYKNGEKIFFCVLDDCNFKVNVKLAFGKTAECWRCGNPFQLNEYSIRLAKPHCNECTKETEKNSTSKFPPTTTSSLKDRLNKVSPSISVNASGVNASELDDSNVIAPIQEGETEEDML